MNSRKFGVAKFATIAIAVTIVGGSWVYTKGWHQFLFAKKLTPAAGAQLIPDEAIMSSFISTDVNNWIKLEQLGLPQFNELFPDEIQEIEGELSEVGISYQRDIQPWIGDSMIALVPTTDSSEIIQDVDALVIIGIDDYFKANNFLKKIQSQVEITSKKTKYKGLDITTYTDHRGNIVNTTLIGNKIVASNEIDTVKKSIDTYKGQPSLINAGKTKEIFQQKLDINNSLAQVYLTNYDRLIASSLQDAELSENTIENFQILQSLSIGIGTEDNKLRLQALAKLNSPIAKQKYTNSPGKIIETLPKETIAFFSGQGISNFWSELSEISSQEPDLKTTFNGLRTSTRFVTGLDLDRDIFGWMDGEFALGIVPSSQPYIPGLNLGLGGAFVLETSDRKTAQNTIDKLDNKFQQNLGISSQKRNIKKTDITQWPISNSNVALSSGWLDKNNLLLTLGSEDTNLLYDSNKPSLEKNPKFQEIVQELPKKNLGYFYLDVEKIMTEISPFLVGQDPTLDKAIAVLNSIKVIGGTTSIIDRENSQTDMVIIFKE